MTTWTDASIAASASRYTKRSDWKREEPAAYRAAIKMGILEQVAKHMPKIVGKVATKWTKEAVLADASKYKSRAEWRASSRAYQMAHRNGWLDEACKHMVVMWRAKWTKDAVCADALKYESVSEWEAASSGAYAAATRNGWFDDATQHMVRKIESWTKEKVLEDARRYQTRGEWFKNSKSYSIARLRGWVKDATEHMKTTISLGETSIYKFLLSHDIEFVHQKTFKDLRDKQPLPYDFYLPGFNLVIEYHGIQHKRGWAGNSSSATEIQRRDAIKEAYAKENSIGYLAIHADQADAEVQIVELVQSYLTEMSKILGISLNTNQRQLTETELSKIHSLGDLSKEEVLERAKMFAAVSDWKKEDSPSYNKATRMGWLDEASSHMTRKIQRSGHWTKENVIASAQAFTTQTAWKDAYGGAWSKAVKEGWIEEATLHMRSSETKPQKYWIKDAVFESAKQFSRLAQWRSNCPSAVAVAYKNGWIEEIKTQVFAVNAQPSV